MPSLGSHFFFFFNELGLRSNWGLVRMEVGSKLNNIHHVFTDVRHVRVKTQEANCE